MFGLRDVNEMILLPANRMAPVNHPFAFGINDTDSDSNPDNTDDSDAIMCDFEATLTVAKLVDKLMVVLFINRLMKYISSRSTKISAI
jgi:hypothetical protein